MSKQPQPQHDQDQIDQQQAGPGSFCVPRKVIDALITANATAYEVVTYLTLARYTDPSGIFSTAGITAVNKATGANKTADGPVSRALDKLKTIRPSRLEEKQQKNKRGFYDKVMELVPIGEPILIDRDTWLSNDRGSLPDGPTERSKVRFILPDMGEDLSERVWFSNALVDGFRDFRQPLKRVKDAGDVAARLLISLYALNDMETWGGVRPVGNPHGPWARYGPVDGGKQVHGGAVIIRAKNEGKVALIPEQDKQAYWDALQALESAGLVYEVVMVLNRAGIEANLVDGDKYLSIPPDAEPLYELDARSLHGYKPAGEEGLGGLTARTAGELAYPVTLARDPDELGCHPDDAEGRDKATFDGTYAAIVQTGFPAMIAGIYRLRFRVANPKNAGVKGAWTRIRSGNRDAFDLINRVRKANRLDALQSPSETVEKAKSAAAEVRQKLRDAAGLNGQETLAGQGTYPSITFNSFQ
jgi:hypothetical protein